MPDRNGAPVGDIRSRRRRFAVAALWVLLASPLVLVAGEIKVTGTGWLEDRLIDRAIRELRGGDRDQIITANAVEDAVFFAMSTVAEEGYLRPQVEATIHRESGEVLVHQFDSDFAALLPRPLRGLAVELKVRPGVRYRFGTVAVRGGTAVISEREALRRLIPDEGLLASGRRKVFTPAALRSGVEQIELRLREQGYAEALVSVTEESRDPVSGHVDVAVSIEPGLRWTVQSINVTGAPETVEAVDATVGPATVWTLTWEQDLVERYRRALFSAGFPDAEVTVHKATQETAGDVQVAVTIAIRSGERVTLTAPRFEGAPELSRNILRRRAGVREGDTLNPLQLDAARRRLARLGALTRVGIRFDPPAGAERAPVFQLTARDPWETSLMLGYGSYEQVRGGVEVRGRNLWGMAHQLRVEAVGSLKSLRGDAVYTVPELFGEAIDGSLRLFGLDRQELSFQRREYGATVALNRRRVPWINAEGTVSYTFQDLSSSESDLATRAVDVARTTSASVTWTLNRDRRDNALNPRRGYRWFGQLEVADEALGGQSGFQRLEFGYSWHRALSDATWLHFGASYGLVLTLGQANDADLPVNKRFFPGGENSLRGMQVGEAAPRDPTGAFVGAKEFGLLNLELEQALTRRLSAVVFWDELAATARLEDPAWGDPLHTVGAGLRYQTLIGPVRLEYGHNLNPRPGDPSGTLHFSLGFPF